MRTTLLLCAFALFLTGCRVNPEIVLLERENRELEDKIWELKDVVRDYQDALDTSRSDNGTPREDSTSSSSGGIRPSDTADPRPSLGQPENGLKSLAPPAVSLPEGTEPEGQVPDTLKVPDVPEHIRRPATDESLPEPPAGASAMGSRQATRLVIHADRCGGYDNDDRPGDEGISISIEPRNAQGQAVDTPGDLIVVVRDPSLQGSAAHVARWEFTAVQMAQMFQRSAPVGAISLALVWPDGRPRHEALRVFVRYIAADGRKLDAEGPIGVRLAADTADGWVPSEHPSHTLQAAKATVLDTVAIEDPVDQGNVVLASHQQTLPNKPEVAPTGSAETGSARPAWSPNRRHKR
jgi:hypothetical protein